MKLPTGPKAHKPADSGVAVGNDARCCSFHDVTYKAFKQALSGIGVGLTGKPFSIGIGVAYVIVR